ncbi:MAG: sigma 54-interacting transcriptional regulator [Deltaproteobacteria bacterium]|nr:sigma 54-interacting transcriptional regulator [Deltaproteobacteria bacterium]
MLLRSRYRVIRPLGKGGGGTVFEVEDLAAGARRIALKAHFHHEDDQALLDLLKEEFRVLAGLRHPWIARVYDFGRIPAESGLEGARGRPGYFFTRELIEGEDLMASVGAASTSLPRICQIFRRVAAVLDVLHRAGAVHGDFKPANVIVSADDTPSLIDFGMARGEGESSFSGTIAYLAPEVISAKQVDRRADLYALGITLYQVLTGKLPGDEVGIAKMIDWHLHGQRPKVSLSRPDVPPSLDELVSRLMHPDPDMRPPDAAEVGVALERVLATLGAPVAAIDESFVAPAPGASLNEPLEQLEIAIRRRLLTATSAEGDQPPSLLAVHGEPGHGKSTLLGELAWRCQLAGIEVARGAFQQGDGRAFGAIVDLLAQIAGIVGMPHPLQVAKAGSLGASGDRYGLMQRICDYLAEAATEQPLLLLLDNVELATAESREALRFLAHTIDPRVPVLLLVAHSKGAEESEALGAPQSVELKGLCEDEVARLYAVASGRHDEALVAKITAHTGGNPQFVLDVLRQLWREGWPTHPDLRQALAPAALEALHERRWAEITSAERDVLAMLAVLGRPSGGMLLMDVMRGEVMRGADGEAGRRKAVDDAAVGLPLERLEALGWLARTSDGAWGLRQAHVAALIVAGLEVPWRKRLHRALLELCGAEANPAERAHHGLAAGELSTVWTDLKLALEQFREMGAFRRAIELVSQALELAQESGKHWARRRDDLRLWLGELLRLAGEVKAAEEVLSPLLEGPAVAERARLELSRVLRAAGEGRRALALLQGLEGVGDELALQGACERAGALAELDDHEAAFEAAIAGLEVEARAPNATLRAELLGRQAWSLGHRERFDEAVVLFERALSVAHSSPVEADLLNRWASVSWRHGRYDQVEQLYTRALSTMMQSGNVERSAVIRFNLSAYLLQRGQYGAALSQLETTLRLFEGMGAQQHAATARCNLGQLQLEVGLVEQAQHNVSRAALAMRGFGRRGGEALAGLLLALLAARRGELDEARLGIGQARETYLAIGQKRDAADALLDLAEVELEAKNFDAAQRARELAAREVELGEQPDLQIRDQCLRVRLLAHAPEGGDAQQAWVELGEALEEALHLDSLRWQWLCRVAGLELAMATGETARAQVHARAGEAVLDQMCLGLPVAAQRAFNARPRRRTLRGLASRNRVVVGERGSLGEVSLLGATLPPMPPSQGPAERERFFRLLEIYRRIASELDLDRLLGLVMDAAVELTGAERGFLLLGDNPEALRLEVSRNIDLEGRAGGYSRSIAERVFSVGQPVITVSAHNDPRFVDYASVHQLRLESVLCIPVHAYGKAVGVLYMESRFQSGRFTPDDQRLLMAFGDQVAIALTNARLYAENSKRAEELEAAKEEIESLAEERGRLLEKRTAQLEQAQRDLAHLAPRTGRFGMVGSSGPMARIFQLIERVATTDVPVLIEGESGTGKEMVARAIHQQSARKKKRLVCINCAAIPENLLESELFGHTRGAFTGADREKKGLFAVADGGTLLLDEIGDMSQRMQVDMLRVLQEKTMRPVGGQHDISIDVRVVAASNKPLAELVRQGRFREDLFYRLHVIRIELPPLRQRRDDIVLLADHFLERINQQMGQRKRLSRGAHERLMAYDWPGNVRQLEHALVNASVLADELVLQAEDFTFDAPLSPGSSTEGGISGSATGSAAGSSLASEPEDRRAGERAQILSALEETGWNRSKAATVMGMPRRTFYRRLKLHGIQ